MADSFGHRMLQREVWIAPAWGLATSIVVGLIGRATAFEHREAAAMAAFFLVMTLVSDHRKGLLKSHPVLSISIAIVMGGFGAAITRL